MSRETDVNSAVEPFLAGVKRKSLEQSPFWESHAVGAKWQTIGPSFRLVALGGSSLESKRFKVIHGCDVWLLGWLIDLRMLDF